MVRNDLVSPMYTSAVRFYPVSYTGDVALRVELYGYDIGKIIVKGELNAKTNILKILYTSC